MGRITKDLNELELPKTCKTEFPDVDDLLNFKLVIYPDEGFYRHGVFSFSFKIGPAYPHEPPKVKCETKVYHPNIDLEGNVCLNILREDWKPVLTINSIVYGLQYLFLEPNPDDPLNKEAALELQSNRRLFEQIVQFFRTDKIKQLPIIILLHVRYSIKIQLHHVQCTNSYTMYDVQYVHLCH